MKKTISIALLFAFFINRTNAQTDTSGRQMYYYYPQQNVYYNQKNHNYMYYDADGANWKTVNLLPPMYNINKQTPKDSLYYNGPDVWMENAEHIKRYGTPVVPLPKEKQQ